MKFKLKDKEFNIQPASARAVIEIEKELGMPLALLGEKPMFTHVEVIFAHALLNNTSDPEVTVDWILDNTRFNQIQEMSEVVADFLAINTP